MTSTARAVVVAGHTGDIDKVLAHRQHADPGVRSAALGALQRTRALTIDHLNEAMADPSAQVRRRAAGLAAAHPDFRLVGALSDVDPSVVDAAAWACGERSGIDDGEFESLLTVAAEHTDPICRESAVAALGAVGDRRALAVILAATHDKPAVRRRAALALAPFDGPEVDDALERLAGDRDWQVRQAAEDVS